MRPIADSPERGRLRNAAVHDPRLSTLMSSLADVAYFWTAVLLAALWLLAGGRLAEARPANSAAIPEERPAIPGDSENAVFGQRTFAYNGAFETRDITSASCCSLPEVIPSGTQRGPASTTIGVTSRLTQEPFATRGVAEVAKHHAWPKYLGGAAKQDLVTLPRKVHEAFHSGLDKILPRQWGAEYYQKLSPAAKEEVLRDLADYTRAFDTKHGTSIFDALVKAGFPAP
jgi:hypothetical protein